MDQSLQLSVLVPVYNEAGNILPLLAEVEAALAGVCAFEIVFVDDGSSDATPAELDEALKNPKVRVLRHKARAGKSAALVTGFWAARAPWIQTLDGDRQNDPADVARVWKMLNAPAPDSALGIVCGVRKRRNDGIIKFLSSRIANFVRRNLLRDNTRDTGCGFKLIRRDIALKLPFFDGMHRFLPALVRRAGYRTMEVPIEDRARAAGVSKYGFFGRLGAGIFDLFGVFWLIRRGTRAEGREIPRP
ncbi:MAG TPA: glycosyltransferase family 2 protein [Rhizomicrobium sp.]|nr:glycosyltransferase family 2 protein [Rhizomicrobium sp.]